MFTEWKTHGGIVVVLFLLVCAVAAQDVVEQHDDVISDEYHNSQQSYASVHDAGQVPLQGSSGSDSVDLPGSTVM